MKRGVLNLSNVRHYQTKGAECIDIMRDFLTTEEFEGALKFNVLKYLYRAGDKRDKAEDFRKAADYACMLAFDCWVSDIKAANSNGD